MIIQNGHIQFLAATGGGLDEVTGHPKKATETVTGNPIPCQYMSSTFDYLAETNGEHFTRRGYTILIENHHEVLSERLVLTDMSGNEIGRYSTVRVDPLDAVCEIKIIV